MIKRFLYLAGLSIIFVVVFHAVGMSFVAMTSWAERYLPPSVPATSQIGGIQYYILRFFEQAAGFAILVFLFISGFFTAIATGRDQKTVSWKVIGGRLKTLIIPYLIWSTVIIILLVLQGHSITWQALLGDILLGRSNPVMYYVPLLVQFYLLSPLLVPLARNRWKVLLTVVGILQLLVIVSGYFRMLSVSAPPWLEIFTRIPSWLFLAQILWFPVGMIVGFHLGSMREGLIKLRWILLALLILFLCLNLVEWEVLYRASGQVWLDYRTTVIDVGYSLLIIFTFMAFSSVRFPLTNRIERMGSQSYGIYLTHALAIEYTARLIYHFIPRLLSYQVILAIILTIVGLAFPLILMGIGSRPPFRKYYSYVFG